VGRERQGGETTPGLPRAVWVLAGVGFLIAVGFGVMSPVLPVYVRLFGVSSFLVGLVLSVFAAVRLVSNPAAGRLLRHLGPRRTVIAGCLLIAVTTFLMGTSDSYASILLWRGLSGVGSACYGVGSLALTFSVAPPHLRGRSNALTGGGFVVGGMAGPALGGLVSQISLHAPFYFYSATLLASAVVVGLLVPPVASGAGAATGPVPLTQFWRDRRFVAALAVNFAQAWQSMGVRALLVPLFVVETLGRTTAATGWAFTIAAVVQFACLAPAGRASDRFGRQPLLLFGLPLMAIVSPFLTAGHSYPVLIGLLCLYSVGAAATGSSTQALLADTVPATAGTALAAFQMASDSGLILGPLVAGAVVDVLPRGWAWGIGSGLLLVASALVGRSRLPPSPASVEQSGVPPAGDRAG